MPNTPALVLAGASAMSGNQNIRQEDMEVAQQIFSAVGTCIEVPENLLDAVTGLSGSGPGYVFTFLEAMIDGEDGALDRHFAVVRGYKQLSAALVGSGQG